MGASTQANRRSDLKNSIKQSENITWSVSFVFPGKSVSGIKKPVFLPLYFNNAFPTGIPFTHELKAPG